MESRIEINPNWPVSALFKFADDRGALQKTYTTAITKILDGRISPALTLLQNIPSNTQSWPIWYAMGLCLMKLGQNSSGQEFIRLASIEGTPHKKDEASVMLEWIAGNKSRARELSQLLHSDAIRDMYLAIIDSKQPRDWLAAEEEKISFLSSEQPRLKINYFMTATNLCGGSKIILEHAHALKSQGHEATIISFDQNPSWYDVTVPFRQTNLNLENIEDLKPFDIAVSGFFWLNQLTMMLAPRTYHFAQGDEMTFEFDRLNDLVKKDVIYQFHNLPNKQLVVSSFLAEAISAHFEREVYDFIPNSVESFFAPSNSKNQNQIMIIGSEVDAFKNVAMMMKACEYLKAWNYPIRVVWVSSQPRKNQIFECEFYHAPHREEIARLYASSNVFLSASDYEASPLPILEAMKSQTAIVTSDNGGIRDYVVHGQNAIVVKPHTAESLARAVANLLDDKAMRSRIAQAGFETSQEFTWEKSMDNLQKCFYRDMAQVWPIISI